MGALKSVRYGFTFTVPLGTASQWSRIFRPAPAAARAVVGDTSVGRGGMGEVGDRGGVPGGAPNKEFGDKAGLGEAVVLREASRFLEGIQKASRQDVAAEIIQLMVKEVTPAAE